VKRGELKRWAKYILWCAVELELRDWSLTIASGPCIEEDAIAQVKPVYGRKLATITLAPGFEYRTREEQRQTIAHELIHLHWHGAREVMRVDVCQQMSQAVYDVADSAYVRAMEYGVDALADAIAKHLPLPDCAPRSTEGGH